MNDLHVCSGRSRPCHIGGGVRSPILSPGSTTGIGFLINVLLFFLHITGWCFHGVLYHLSCNGWNYHHLLQYRDFFDQRLWILLRLWLWARLLQLWWKDGHSRHNAYPGHYCIWDWNLGSNMCLFNEAMRLLRTTGKSGVSSFILKIAQKFQWDYRCACCEAVDVIFVRSGIKCYVKALYCNRKWAAEYITYCTFRYFSFFCHKYSTVLYYFVASSLRSEDVAWVGCSRKKVT